MGWTFTAIAAAVIVAGIAFYMTGPVRTPTAANLERLVAAFSHYRRVMAGIR
jgi:hypothetical protein